MKNRIMQKYKAFLLLGFLLCSTTLVNNYAFADDSKSPLVENVSDSAKLDWNKSVIKVTGSGVPPEKGSLAQKRTMAIRAARIDAYRQLLEAVNGIHVSSETIVKDFVTESDTIKTKVEGLLKGFEQVGEPRYMSDGSVEIDVQVRLFGKESLASVLMPEEIKKIKNDTIPDTKIEPKEVAEEYTGVIIDCKGVDVEPAMSPALYDSEGSQVYVGNLPIDPDYVINDGIVAYSKSMDEAKKNSRVGKNPLVLKAVKSFGNFKSDIVLKNEDVKTLLGADKNKSFLKEFKVVMVL
jgi:hypothetical protein